MFGFLCFPELTEEAKADLLEFEEKERQKKQGRFGGARGRGGVRGGGLMGRGRGGGGSGRGGLPMFGMLDFRGDGGLGRGRINEQRPPLMQVNLGTQVRHTTVCLNSCLFLSDLTEMPIPAHVDLASPG